MVNCQLKVQLVGKINFERDRNKVRLIPAVKVIKNPTGISFLLGFTRTYFFSANNTFVFVILPCVVILLGLI